MTTSSRSVVMGIFRDRTLAQQAVDELKQTDWGVEDIRLLGGTSGGVLETLKQTVAGRDTSRETPSETLTEFGLPADQQQLYVHALEHGSFIVVAHIHTHFLEARDVLNHYGAYQVVLPLQLGGEQTIRLRQEVAQVQKHLVDVGEIRIHKRLITEEKTFTVPVTREEVTIERVPLQTASLSSAQQRTAVDPTMAVEDQARANAPASSSLGETEILHEAGTIRIVVREEQVIIQKQPVIVEEIIIQKQVVQETKHLVEPIRHEEARIEKLGNISVREQGSDAASFLPSDKRA